MRFQKLFYVVASLLLFSINSVADDITLDFEGLKDYEEVQSFYDGGTGSKGSTKGLDYNITFSANTLALIDRDAGGNGNFANEPSPDTIFFFTGSSTNIYMNVEGGFTEGFSFYYTSTQYEGDVEVWTEPNGQGKKIGSLHLDITPSLGKGDPNGTYDNWAKKSLSFDGRAKSIVFKGVANQIGFDNITLNPDAGKEVFYGTTISSFHEVLDDDTLSRDPSNPYANTFRAKFDLKTKENDLMDLCDKFDFYIVGDDNRGAEWTKCSITKYDRPLDIFDTYTLTLDFEIPEKDGGYYFENGKLQVCNKGKKGEDDCKQATVWKNFSIYSTNFNLKKDAYNFNNGDWNKAIKNTDKTKGIEYKNDVMKMTDIVISYLKGMKEEDKYKKDFYKAIGYSFTTTEYNFFGKPVTDDPNEGSYGLCYGMTHSSMANFVNRSSKAWGQRKVEKFKKDIDEHWINKEADKNAQKPFITNDIYTKFNKNNLESLKKILYYNVAQGYFENDKDVWIGKAYSTRLCIDKKCTDKTFLAEYESDTKEYFIKNIPIPFSFSYFIVGGSHSVLNTQVIIYDNHKRFYFYDNSRNKEYSTFKYTLIGNGNLYNTGLYSNGLIIKDFSISLPVFNRDPLHVFPVQNKTTKNSYKKRLSNNHKTTNEIQDINYISNQHIEIYTVGGSFKKVTLKSDNSAIKLYPISATLEKDKAYKNEANIFNNTLLLPVDKQYKVTVKKEAGFITLKLFVTIPKADGTAEYLVYDHAETSKEDATMVTFTVGRDNADKSLKREGASDYAPDTEKIYKLKLASATSINAIVLENGVKLSWQNPVYPNYEESVVVRKEDSVPTSMTDGTEIYRGTDEEFLDTTVGNDKKYYYAVYAVSKDNESTEPVWTKVDTYRYTLYGTLSDASDEPISGATVTLYNGTKTRLIDTSFSSQNGLFTFNNLLDGEYVLNFSHPSYTFEKSELNVTVEKKSKELLLKAEGVANLFMNIPQAVKVGEVQTIIWDGVHIDDSATVNIKLFRDEKWETVASSVPYNQHSYKWNVTAPKGEAKIRVELDDTTFVEKDVFIFGADELKYDFDGDGDIDIDDIMVVVKGWNSKIGDADYNSAYDYNGDGVIDIKDIMKIASMWGK